MEMGRPAGSNGTRRSKVRVREQLAKAFLIGGLAAILASAIIVWAVGGFNSSPQLTEAQEDGKAYYGQNCASCHEENQLQLKKIPPNLHGLFNRSKLPSGAPATDAEVHNVILKGKNTMPSFDQRLSDEQVRYIVAYLHTGIR